MEIGFDIAGDSREFLFGGYAAFGNPAFLKNALGLFLILPEIGLRGLALQFGDKRTMAGNVKDNSARVRFSPLSRESDVPGLQESWIFLKRISLP
jgi:hypothetical protein